MPALVLVAEDDDDLREAVAWSLRAEGYRVIDVGDGQAALWALRMRPVDLFIVDLKLPSLDGGALLRLVRDDEQLQHTPVVVITGHPEAAPPDVALIKKPFSMRMLNSVVNGILAGKPRRRTAENLPPLGADENEDDAAADARTSDDRTGRRGR
jgi:DNA-binding response OmpR family regulator